MNRKATIIECVLAVVVLCFALSAYLERSRGRDDGKLVTLHTHTVVTQTIAAEAEKVLVKDTLPIKAARDSLRSLRDSVLGNPRDTVRVKEYVTRTEQVIALDSTALAQATTVIHDLHDVVTAKDAELAEALKPKYSPRLRYEVAGWYAPLSGTVSGSAGAAVRVTGGLSAVVRVDQRLALGEKPDLRVGVTISF